VLAISLAFLRKSKLLCRPFLWCRDLPPVSQVRFARQQPLSPFQGRAAEAMSHDLLPLLSFSSISGLQNERAPDSSFFFPAPFQIVSRAHGPLFSSARSSSPRSETGRRSSPKKRGLFPLPPPPYERGVRCDQCPFFLLREKDVNLFFSLLPSSLANERSSESTRTLPPFPPPVRETTRSPSPLSSFFPNE